MNFKLETRRFCFSNAWLIDQIKKATRMLFLNELEADGDYQSMSNVQQLRTTFCCEVNNEYISIIEGVYGIAC